MKTVVVTGASRGIGLATAQKFLTEGWRVIGAFLHSPPAIEDPNFVSVLLDLASEKSIQAAVNEIQSSGQTIDGIVNNAGVFTDYTDVSADLNHIRETFEVNVFGTVAFTEQLLPSVPSGGHIVIISSGLGSFSEPIEATGMLGYRMSKASLNMYTRVLAFQLKERGIIVSSMTPGWVNTEMGRIGRENPPREPGEAASDIYTLVTSVTDMSESGNFWKFGTKKDW